MKQPLQINFRDIPHSDAVEARVREKVWGQSKNFCCSNDRLWPVAAPDQFVFTNKDKYIFLF